jgi:hypothetical protein
MPAPTAQSANWPFPESIPRIASELTLDHLSVRLASARSSESLEGNLCLHSLPRTSSLVYTDSSSSSALASFRSAVSKPSVNQL